MVVWERLSFVEGKRKVALTVKLSKRDGHWLCWTVHAAEWQMGKGFEVFGTGLVPESTNTLVLVRASAPLSVIQRRDPCDTTGTEGVTGTLSRPD